VSPDVRWLGRIPYAEAWALQRELHEQVATGTAPDTLLLLEHDSVYTAGRRTDRSERPTDPDTPVIEVDRGGKITWHGPGQLVGYPLVRLPEPVDVIGHVRRIEDLLISACAALGVPGRRIDGRSGVWAGAAPAYAKVAAVGVRVARGATMHGFALNCDCDLTAFDPIVPCGIRDAGVTSLSVLTGRTIGVADARDAVLAALTVSGWRQQRAGAPVHAGAGE
jgi:lipoyl(octanoyl) transferase